MKLLVFGANSQLGRELVHLLEANNIDHAALTTDDVDVLKQKDVVKAVSRVNPTQLINVSTYTNLQKAESDQEAARLCDLINTEGVTALAKVCEQLNIPMLHHSSSYVFDGQKKEPYREEDETNPVCRYGLSKWYGERTLREVTDRHIILRTDWLFSEYRNNYFHMLIRACKENGGKVPVVDNRFSPTHAADAARVILGMVKQVDCSAEVWGTYHYNAMQPLNQDQFVVYVLEEAAKLDKALEKLLPNLKTELQEVEKPYIRNSSLNCEKIMATFGVKQRSRAPYVIRVLEDIYGIKPKMKNVKPPPAPVKPLGEVALPVDKSDPMPKRKKAAAKNARRSKRPARKAARQKQSPSP